MNCLDFPSNFETLMFCLSATCCGCCWWGWDFCPPYSAEAFLRYLSVASSTSETSCPIVAGSCNHSKSALIQHYNQCGITICNMLYHNVSSSNYIKISSPVPIWPEALDMFRKRHPGLSHLWEASISWNSHFLTHKGKQRLPRHVSIMSVLRTKYWYVHLAFDSLQQMKEEGLFPYPVGFQPSL